MQTCPKCVKQDEQAAVPCRGAAGSAARAQGQAAGWQHWCDPPVLQDLQFPSEGALNFSECLGNGAVPQVLPASWPVLMVFIH